MGSPAVPPPIYRWSRRPVVRGFRPRHRATLAHVTGQPCSRDASLARRWRTVVAVLAVLVTSPSGPVAAASPTPRPAPAPLPLRVTGKVPRALLLHPTQQAWQRCALPFAWSEARCGLITVRGGALTVQLAAAWGGAIASIVYRGHELVDHHDTGRLVQLALRDNCSESWNPTQGGGAGGFGQGVGSPTRAVRVSADAVAITSEIRDWQSDRLTHVFVTQTVSVLAPDVLRVQYVVLGRGIRADHLRPTPSACPANEMPAVYAGHRLTAAYAYTGQHPWAGRPVSRIRLPGTPSSATGGNLTAAVQASEHWLALIDPHTGVGLALLIPHPPAQGGQWIAAAWVLMHPRPNYIGLHVPLPIVNGSIARETVYLVAGTLPTIRHRIYALHQALCARPGAAPPLWLALSRGTPPFCPPALPAP